MGKRAKSDSGIRYVLTLTPDQANILSHACEFFARIRMGQWHHILWDCLDISRDDFCDRRDAAEKSLLDARSEVYPELSKSVGHSYGVGKFEDADQAWELYEVLRNKIAWTENPGGGHGVNFYPPMSLVGRPLAECEVVTLQDKKARGKAPGKERSLSK